MIGCCACSWYTYYFFSSLDILGILQFNSIKLHNSSMWLNIIFLLYACHSIGKTNMSKWSGCFQKVKGVWKSCPEDPIWRSNCCKRFWKALDCRLNWFSHHRYGFILQVVVGAIFCPHILLPSSLLHNQNGWQTIILFLGVICCSKSMLA